MWTTRRGPRGRGGRAGVLFIGGLYGQVEAALAQRSPGEGTSGCGARSTHLGSSAGPLYLDLMDPEEDSGRGGARGGRGGSRSCG